MAATAIRPCRDDERDEILEIVNAAAEAYRGVIPEDRWREPYMERGRARREIAAGVVFWGYESGGELAGVMGVQAVRDVDLIRHAYVRPEHQGEGIGRRLLEHLTATAPSGRCWSGPGPRRSGRSASTSATASSRSRPRRRIAC